MNDRFKFRAWSKRIEKFIYNIQDVGVDFSIECWEDCFGDFLNNENYIIEQCTSLKDKNGKLIYEGDILTYPLQEESQNTIQIIWHKGGFWQHCKNKYGVDEKRVLHSWSAFDLDRCIIIGNIHENADLLGEKNNGN